VYRARIFIDFWNFQLNWNSETPISATGESPRCDWKALPRVLTEAATGVVATTEPEAVLSLEETLVHASYNPTSEADRKLKGWLDNFLDKQPSFRVKIRERRPQPTRIRCTNCQHELEACPECSSAYVRYPEKGVDSAILVDLLTLAWEGAYDVAILLSGDADLVPGVDRVQEKGLKVINATWKSRGHHLAKACWGSFPIDNLVNALSRPA
jgi:hypothetical protein